MVILFHTLAKIRDMYTHSILTERIKFYIDSHLLSHKKNEIAKKLKINECK